MTTRKRNTPEMDVRKLGQCRPPEPLAGLAPSPAYQVTLGSSRPARDVVNVRFGTKRTGDV